MLTRSTGQVTHTQRRPATKPYCRLQETSCGAASLQADAGVLVLKVSEVLLCNEVQDPHQAGNTHKHPAEGGVVDAEREADAVTVEAVVDLQAAPAGAGTNTRR